MIIFYEIESDEACKKGDRKIRETRIGRNTKDWGKGQVAKKGGRKESIWRTHPFGVDFNEGKPMGGGVC